MIGSVLRVVAILALLIILAAACGEPESPRASDASPDPTSSAALTPTPGTPPTPTSPPATPAGTATPHHDGFLQTVEEVLAPGATRIDLTSLLEQGKDGQPGRVVSVQRMRLGDALVQDNWASQDLSRQDGPDESVWEIEVANVQVGHSCRMGATPEQCNWDHLIWVIHATTGETIGLRYPDTVPPPIPPEAHLQTVEDAITSAHDLVLGHDGQDARIVGIWLLTPAEADLGEGWGEATPIWQVEMEGGAQPPGPCMAPQGVEVTCPADHLMLHLHAATGDFLGYRLIEPPATTDPETPTTSGVVLPEEAAIKTDEEAAAAALASVPGNEGLPPRVIQIELLLARDATQMPIPEATDPETPLWLVKLVDAAFSFPCSLQDTSQCVWNEVVVALDALIGEMVSLVGVSNAPEPSPSPGGGATPSPASTAVSDGLVPTVDPALVGTGWDLASHNGGPPDGWAASLVFEPWGIRGSAVCDTYWSTGTVVRDGVVEIPDITKSGAGCPSEMMAAEVEMQRYFETLLNVTRYELGGDWLRLETDDGRVLLFTRRGDDVGSIAPEFMGTMWRLVSLNGEALPEGAPITLGFGLEAMIVCNWYNVTVTMTSHGDLSIDVLGVTAQGCETASMTLAEYNDLTDRYLDSLIDVERYERDGDGLRLITTDGRELVYVATAGGSTP